MMDRHIENVGFKQSKIKSVSEQYRRNKIHQIVEQVSQENLMKTQDIHQQLKIQDVIDQELKRNVDSIDDIQEIIENIKNIINQQDSSKHLDQIFSDSNGHQQFRIKRGQYYINSRKQKNMYKFQKELNKSDYQQTKHKFPKILKTNDDLVLLLKKIKYSNNRNIIDEGVIEEYFKEVEKIKKSGKQ